jgi:hypothetical protein
MFLSKEYNIALSEIRALPYFKYEWILEEAQADNKEAARRQEAQEKEMQSMRSNYKMPSYSPPKMPKMSVPRF